MIAYDLKAGQRFTMKHDSGIFVCVDDNRPADWLKYPGIVYRDVESGKYGGLGGGNDIVLCDDIRPAAMSDDKTYCEYCAKPTVSAADCAAVGRLRVYFRQDEKLVERYGVSDEGFTGWLKNVLRVMRVEDMQRVKKILEAAP
jgi:hypothetical protein